MCWHEFFFRPFSLSLLQSHSQFTMLLHFNTLILKSLSRWKEIIWENTFFDNYYIVWKLLPFSQVPDCGRGQFDVMVHNAIVTHPPSHWILCGKNHQFISIVYVKQFIFIIISLFQFRGMAGVNWKPPSTSPTWPTTGVHKRPRNGTRYGSTSSY